MLLETHLSALMPTLDGFLVAGCDPTGRGAAEGRICAARVHYSCAEGNLSTSLRCLVQPEAALMLKLLLGAGDRCRRCSWSGRAAGSSSQLQEHRQIQMGEWDEASTSSAAVSSLAGSLKS